MGSTEDATGVVHDAHTPPLTTITPAMTHHIADHLHIEALPLTLQITAGHALDQPKHPPEKVCTNPLLTPTDHEAKHIS